MVAVPGDNHDAAVVVLGDNHVSVVVVPGDNDVLAAVVPDDNDVLAMVPDDNDVLAVQDDGVCPLGAKSYHEYVAMHSIAASELHDYQVMQHQFHQR